MVYFVAGPHHSIVERLQRERREGEIVLVHFASEADVTGEDGWTPSADAMLFPVEPQIGDIFLCKGYLSKGEESPAKSDITLQWWKVTGRELLTTGTGALEMTGILLLRVKRLERGAA